jgi:hypothetical protein
MNIRYTLIALGLTVGLAQGATSRVGAVGTDFDKVLSIPSKTTQALQAMKILGVKDAVRGLWLYVTVKEIRDAINAARDTNLKDANGLPVIGAEGYVNYLFKDMPFVSEEKKKRLARVELIFKPNVALIEYYQKLQDQGIIVYVWTDNDEAGYKRKLEALNAALATLGKKPFVPNGFHCAKVGTTERGYSKIHSEYFRDAYNEMMAAHGATIAHKAVLFVDDKIDNITSALKARDEYKLNLEAVLYDSKKTKLQVIEEKVGTAIVPAA